LVAICFSPFYCFAKQITVRSQLQALTNSSQSRQNRAKPIAESSMYVSILAALQALPCRWLWEVALTTGSDVTASEPWCAYSIESSVPGCAQTWSLRRNPGNCSTSLPCKLQCKLVVGTAVPKGKSLCRNNQTSKWFQYLVKFLIGAHCYYLFAC